MVQDELQGRVKIMTAGRSTMAKFFWRVNLAKTKKMPKISEKKKRKRKKLTQNTFPTSPISPNTPRFPKIPTNIHK